MPPGTDGSPGQPVATAPREAGRSAPGEEADQQFFIVGVGASAGGLEALGALLKHVDLESMALVVVQHLAPKHESALPALLARVSPVEVVPAAEGLKVEPNHVYVLPPNADLAILQGVLHLMPPPEGQSVHLPIDYFFRSLAQDRGAHSIGVVLSGTGTDGTFGLKAIKEVGGITFAQAPESAKYDGMPRSALASGWADFCLPPAAIAERLKQVAQHSYLAPSEVPPPAHEKDTTGRLLVMIRAAYGTDLSYYKPSMIDRRVERRMALHRIEKLDDYIRLVQSNPGELALLYRDMLIGVTSFFRDHEPFEALKTKVFPSLMEGREAGSQIRLWVPACSTGEEAYSLAISLLEFLGDRSQDFRIQIFGTDIDQTVIQHARRGVYPQNITLDVSPERLHRFFVKRESDYHISRRIRDMVVFSVQNVTKDPPFSKVDMVSCRNLLIYLLPSMQKRVLRVLHYSLQPEGFLLLGTSEAVGDSADLFAPVDRTNKIYVRRHVEAMAALDIGAGDQQAAASSGMQASPTRAGSNIAALAERKVLEMYGPPGVVITGEMDVVHIRGHTAPYLEPMPGTPSFNLLRLARPELHLDLRRTIQEAQTKGSRATALCTFPDDGALRQLELEVIPLGEAGTRTRFFLVLFHEVEQREPATAALIPAATGSPEEARLRELERELVMTKEYLQSTVEELESTNEELKSSNEEMQSSNEELQSTNEELETSKEELQSTNEELTTVNDELQDRMVELQQTNDDLHNILRAMGNVVVIVGMDLRIRRYTEAAGRLFNLIAGDVGRSIAQLNAFVTGEHLEEIATNVISTLSPISREVLCANQRWYQLEVTPYRTLDHSIKGAVIALLDVDSHRRSPASPADLHQFAEAWLGPADRPLLIADSRLRVLWVSAAFEAAFDVARKAVVGGALHDVGPGGLKDGKFAALVERLAAAGEPFRGFRLRAPGRRGGKRMMAVSGTLLPAVHGERPLLLLSFDIQGKPGA